MQGRHAARKGENEMIDTSWMQSPEEILDEMELSEETGRLEADMTVGQLITFLKNNPDCPVTLVPVRKGV